jgi:protein tyrosine/serine phosphatase
MSFIRNVEPAVVRKALSAMTDPASQPVFVHCSRGVDRTGVVAAVYRMEVDGWSKAEAEAEMEAFGFHDVWSQLKKFVRQYQETREEVQALDGP